MKFKIIEEFKKDSNGKEYEVIDSIQVTPSFTGREELRQIIRNHGNEFYNKDEIFYCDEENFWDDSPEYYGLVKRGDEYVIPPDSKIKIMTAISPSGWIRVNINDAEEELDLASDLKFILEVRDYADNILPIDSDYMLDESGVDVLKDAQKKHAKTLNRKHQSLMTFFDKGNPEARDRFNNSVNYGNDTSSDSGSSGSDAGAGDAGSVGAGV